MRVIKAILAAAAITLIPLNAHAQRRITPVENPATRTQHISKKISPDSLDRTNIVEKTDSRGNIILVDTITGKEVVDSTRIPNVPPMIYPRIYAVSVGVNVWDPMMRLFGQKYGLVEFSGELNMHNRYLPVVEIGLGQADNTPDGNNYTYRSPMAPYFRIGANYNFLYNSSPDYMAMAGVRYGFSPFSYTVKGTSVGSSYWGTDETIDIPSQHVTAGYFAILFNLRVRIAGPVYVGWAFSYHSILHESKTPHGQPWYIPGYGTRTSSISGALTVSYTLDLAGRRGKKQAKQQPGTTPLTDLPLPRDDNNPPLTETESR